MGEIDPRDLLPAPVQRVRLRNFRSIRACDVELGNLNVLVGPNASGKSNFLDALQFTRDALHLRLGEALRIRGGFPEVCRKSSENSNSFWVRLDLMIPNCVAAYAFYAFEVASAPSGGFVVGREKAEFVSQDGFEGFDRFGDAVETSTNGVVAHSRAPASDEFFLSRAAAGRAVFEQLQELVVYNFDPVAMRQPQRSEPHDMLVRDGRNLGGVLRKRYEPRVGEYLSAILPGLLRVEGVNVGGYDTFHVTQQSFGDGVTSLSATSVSDGTLRALAVLVALLTRSAPSDGSRRPALIAIEEIEAGLHPGAVGVLWDAMCEASQRSQVIASTHSPDLLDRDDLEGATLLGVAVDGDSTVIGPPSGRDMWVLREKLCTAGELMRQTRLPPNPAGKEVLDAEVFWSSSAPTRA